MTLSRRFNAQAGKSGDEETIKEKEDESARAGHIMTRFLPGGAARKYGAAIEEEKPEAAAAQESRNAQAPAGVPMRQRPTPRAP
jgi:hypothetical protein